MPVQKPVSSPIEAVESFTVRLPADVSRRVRFFAAESQFETIEAYLAAAAVGWVVSDSEGIPFAGMRGDMEARVTALNRGGIKS